MTRPLALLSNDDGYFSRGLRAVREALSVWADVVVVAPETEQSASSHALSLSKPLRIRRVDEGAFAIDGTPADCVYVALCAGTRLLPRRPDVVVSGINRGMNLGQDVFYSGTVAAAREAALRDIPSLATSAHVTADLAAVALLASDLASDLIDRARGETTPVLLNLNVPEKWTGELRAARTGRRLYEDMVEFREDPRGRDYIWLGGSGGVRHDPDPGSDTEAYDAGAASLTRLSLDLTSTGDTISTDLVLASASPRSARTRKG